LLIDRQSDNQPINRQSTIDNRQSAILLVRLFIGTEIDDEMKRRAAAIAAALREQIGTRAQARWIPSDNLHITLWFIGEVDEERTAAITRSINTPFLVPAFDLQLRGVAAFPPSGHPRVFWIGVARGGDSMRALYNELARRLTPLGFEPERRAYSAHLTIARVKECRSRHVRNILQGFDADAGTCRISAVTLFRSRLSPKGATYEPLLRVPLERSA
jgi:RNA 2',3'-cyclic 3'-phosphodiesterase